MALERRTPCCAFGVEILTNHEIVASAQARHMRAKMQMGQQSSSSRMRPRRPPGLHPAMVLELATWVKSSELTAARKSVRDSLPYPSEIEVRSLGRTPVKIWATSRPAAQ
eukprot:scaffold131299_cov28-Tisochrysis_lutea.AAC.3